jgi:hypothetical protein
MSGISTQHDLPFFVVPFLRTCSTQLPLTYASARPHLLSPAGQGSGAGGQSCCLSGPWLTHKSPAACTCATKEMTRICGIVVAALWGTVIAMCCKLWYHASDYQSGTVVVTASPTVSQVGHSCLWVQQHCGCSSHTCRLSLPTAAQAAFPWTHSGPVVWFSMLAELLHQLSQLTEQLRRLLAPAGCSGVHEYRQADMSTHPCLVQGGILVEGPQCIITNRKHRLPSDLSGPHIHLLLMVEQELQQWLQ